MPDPVVVMSLRKYASHRRVTPMAVSYAAKAGRLDKSVARDPTGRVLGIIDVALADREWEANTDTTKIPPTRNGVPIPTAPVNAPAPVEKSKPPVAERDPAPESEGEPPSLANASAQAKLWDARTKELKYREAAGELVPAADVEREVRDACTNLRTHLLALPSNAKQQLAHLTPEDMSVLESLVREALEQLAAISETAEDDT